MAEGFSSIFSSVLEPGSELDGGGGGGAGVQAHLVRAGLGWMVVWALLLSSRAAEERCGWMGGKRSSGGKDT
jgi:hypothetical protein